MFFRVCPKNIFDKKDASEEDPSFRLYEGAMDQLWGKQQESRKSKKEKKSKKKEEDEKIKKRDKQVLKRMDI